MGAFNDRQRRLQRKRSEKRGAESLKLMLGLFALPFLIFFWIFKILFWPLTLFFKKR